MLPPGSASNPVKDQAGSDLQVPLAALLVAVAQENQNGGLQRVALVETGLRDWVPAHQSLILDITATVQQISGLIHQTCQGARVAQSVFLLTSSCG